MAVTEDPRARYLRQEGYIFHGGHADRSQGTCVMEMVSYLAGMPHSDHPVCTSEYITGQMIYFNDQLDDQQRQALRAIIPAIMGTADHCGIRWEKTEKGTVANYQGVEDRHIPKRALTALEHTLRVQIPFLIERQNPELALRLRTLPLFEAGAERCVRRTVEEAIGRLHSAPEQCLTGENRDHYERAERIERASSHGVQAAGEYVSKEWAEVGQKARVLHRDAWRGAKFDYELDLDQALGNCLEGIEKQASVWRDPDKWEFRWLPSTEELKKGNFWRWRSRERTREKV